MSILSLPISALDSFSSLSKLSEQKESQALMGEAYLNLKQIQQIADWFWQFSEELKLIWSGTKTTQRKLFSLPEYDYIYGGSCSLKISPKALDRCSICLDIMWSGLDTKKTLCHHTFHKECLKQSLSVDPRCPLCRTNQAVDPLLPTYPLLTLDGRGLSVLSATRQGNLEKVRALLASGPISDGFRKSAFEEATNRGLTQIAQALSNLS